MTSIPETFKAFRIHDDSDGYRSVQVTFGKRRASLVNKPVAGHYAKAGVEAGEGLWELRLPEGVGYGYGVVTAPDNSAIYVAHSKGVSIVDGLTLSLLDFDPGQGVDQVIDIPGGAQAIAAMAHGTESIPAVNKIFGPGNQYVTMAKQIVSRDTVAIDMPAGPSGLAVIADGHANPSFIASDLLSQAEHGTDSQVLLVTVSESMARQVRDAVEHQLADLPRAEIAAGAGFLIPIWQRIIQPYQGKQ